MSENEPKTISENDSENRRETYPIKPYSQVETFVANVYKKYGASEIISIHRVADANNLAVNSIKQTVSTAQQYSAMRNIHGKGYKITDQFVKIYHPENEDERMSTIIDCLRSVPFYKPLFNDFIDKAVPSIEGLQNRFIREYKMKPHIAKNAAEVFVQNLTDFGLVNSRNILILPVTNKTLSAAELGANHNTVVQTEKQKTTSSTNNIEDDDLVKIPIRLRDNRMAYLSFPNDFQDDDLIKIFKVLKAYIEAYGDNINLQNT